jgi:uncharacterized membrane protein YfcA
MAAITFHTGLNGQPAGSSFARCVGALGARALRNCIPVIAVAGLSITAAEGLLLSQYGAPNAAVFLVAILVASTISSIVGFAFSALCGAVLFHLVDSPVESVRVMLVCSIAMQSLQVATLWRSIDWRKLPAFLLGGISGVPIGVYLLLHLQSGSYRYVIGTLLLAYGSYSLLWRPKACAGPSAMCDACAGFLSGITGGLAGLPSVFVNIWCDLKGWDKTRQRGIYQPFILCMQIVTFIAIQVMQASSSNASPDLRAAVFVPVALFGAWCGLNIFKRLSDRAFGVAVKALLVLSGVGLIV